MVQYQGFPSLVTVTVAPAPTLVSIAITPASPSIVSGNSVQLTATGTYSDSSTANLTGSVTWAVPLCSPPLITTGSITPAGLFTGNSPVLGGSCAVTATKGAIIGIDTVTITP
ncbi:MAG TPA: Ig-like domain-containing protein [Candidatus Acidoferrales bacterium]